MRAEMFWIPGDWSGRLAIAQRPRGGDWLGDELRAWRQAGVDVVVSLLEPAEEREFALEAEPNAAAAAGLIFRSFPIPDRGVPESRREAAALAADIVDMLASGKTVLIHCRQGIGRSGLVAAAILATAGFRPAEALETIRQARGVPVPETAEQHRWISDFSDSLAGVSTDEKRRPTGSPG